MEATTKLPMWSTVKTSYALAWKYRGDYLKIAYAWFLVLFTLQFMHNQYAWPWLQEEMCGIKLPENTAPSIIATILSFPLGFISVFAASSVAVAWHRLLLRDERITTNIYLRADKVVWSYCLFGCYLWIIIFLPTLAFGLIAFIGNPDSTLMPLIAAAGFAYFLLVMIAFIRIPVMLPAKALSLRRITISDTWERTRRNFCRLLGGNILCMLANIPIGIIFSLEHCESGEEGIALYTLSEILPIFLIAPITLSFLSLSFHHFFEKNTPMPSVK